MSTWWDWDGPLCDYGTPNDALTHAPPPDPPERDEPSDETEQDNEQ